jgi:D-serine deaminase-like pyridoxal phosphate-dependent protein
MPTNKVKVSPMPVTTDAGLVNLDKVLNDIIQMNQTRTVSTVTVGTSPWTYVNNDGVGEDILVSGGTVSAVQISVDGGVTFISAGYTSGKFSLLPGDQLQITYTAAPTVYKRVWATVPP